MIENFKIVEISFNRANYYYANFRAVAFIDEKLVHVYGQSSMEESEVNLF